MAEPTIRAAGLIVWPSDESAEFYEREGFKRPDEPLIWHSRN